MKRLLLLAVVVLLWPGAAHADTGPYVPEYRRFQASIDVQADGSVVVEERITVDFRSFRHGIFRDIPVRFDIEGDPEHDRITRITGVSVEGGPFELSKVDRFQRIKIGDPDQHVTGVRTYVIRYLVEGALNETETGVELLWNVTGSAWEGAFSEVTVGVRGPGPVQRSLCFSGAVGTDGQCPVGPQGRRAVVYGAYGIGAYGSDMTVAVEFPPGSATVPPPILVENWTIQKAFAVTPATMGATAAMAVVVALLVAGRLRRGRDEYEPGKRGDLPAPVQFRPPEGLRPAHLGVIADEVCHPVDVGATIVDLAVRGHLTIEDRREPCARKPDWWVKKREGANPDELAGFEWTLLSGLFATGDEVDLDDLKGTFHATFADVKNQLYDDTMKRGWYGRRPDRTRALWIFLGILLVVVAVGATVALAAFTELGWVGVPLLAGAAVMLVGSRWMPARTPSGAKALADARGFKRYLETAEAEEMEYATGQNLFVQYLPYAVAFGVVPAWTRAFAGLDMAAVTASGWFYGPYIGTFDSFGDSMSNFGASAGTVLSAVPASSGGSGFSGGGFSGGGFGGGGGGSW